jgi:acyl-CoA synthetase (AMP-forming)/AMP-acid ligase II
VIRETLRAVAARAPTRPAIVGAAHSTSWAELAEAAAAPLEAPPVGAGVVGLRLLPEGPVVARFLARALAGAPTVLLPPTGALEAHAAALGLDAVLDGEALRPGPGGLSLAAGDVALVTSGTTGAPKIVRHSLASLARPVRARPELDGAVWLATYPLGLYAGLQVLLHALLGGGTLVAPPPGGDASELARRMAATGVTHVSATPSWWRRLLLFGDRAALAAVPLRQATLGGEVADQAILDGVARCWPGARVAHLYATSELGRCFSVTDGLEGFPAAWLGVERDGVTLRVEEDELIGASANRMRGYVGGEDPSAWVRTGDLVEVREGRVRFVGRRTDRLNVGGNKVDPVSVEQVLRACPAVRDVRVYGKRSSLAGELVAADLVADGPAADALAAARAWALEHLPAPARPRLWKVVDEIEVAASGKRVRRQ